MDDESRFDYYDHIEDAKSAKYKAKIEFYTNQDKDENAALTRDQIIEHGRFFFYDTIIPSNESLDLDPSQFDESDIFHDEDVEFEEYDEDYIGFSTTDEINNNLSSANIITRSLKFFSEQSVHYNKQNKVAKHFFFDSKDDSDNQLLTQLFDEIQVNNQPQQIKQTKTTPPGIIEIINNKLNQQQRTEQFEQAANKLQESISKTTSTSVYQQFVLDFLNSYPDTIKSRSFFEQNQEVSFTNNNYINELFDFEQKQYQLKIPKRKLRFKIVYLTSGGGKTTLSKQHKLYLDIDTFIARHYNKFKIVERFCEAYKNYSLMSLFFKHTFYKDIDFLQGKIILCNHPNQVPNQFRLGYNELILVPENLNWDIRWFNENYFSLLATQGKIKYLSNYSNYGKIIFNHFIKFRKKDFINQDDV